MGTTPDNSVIDADHRIWGVPNVLIADGSCAPPRAPPTPR